MRGEILSFGSGEGVIAGDDGNRYAFGSGDYRREAPAAGTPVDFVAEADRARDIYPLVGTSAFAANAHAAIRSINAAHNGAPLPPETQPRIAATIGPPPQRGLFALFFRALTDDYASFRGRARRKEFWGFTLFTTIGLLLLLVLIAIGIGTSNFSSTATNIALSPLLFIGSGFLVLFGVALVCPSLAVTVRRLHDAGISGWAIWLHVVPVLGTLVVFILMCVPGERAANRYGPPTT